MSLTAPIPYSAMPLVDAIRCRVSRPTKKARVIEGWWGTKSKSIYRIRWPNSCYVGGTTVDRRKYGCCPMGMLPNAETPHPVHVNGQASVVCVDFIDWFDSQTDIPAVLDAIWPPVEES